MKNYISIRIGKIFTISDNNTGSNGDIYWVQYVAGFIAALSMINCGTQLTWFGPALPILQNEEISPIPSIKNTESAWVNSMLQVGAVPGSFLGSYLANNIGRKDTIIFTIIPNIICYLLIMFVQDVYMLYVARFFAGINTGVSFVIVPIYLSEISTPKIRGIMGTFSTIILSFSLVLQNILQPLMTLQLSSIISCIMAIVQCLLATCLLQETPLYYIMKGKDSLAEKSLQVLRRKTTVENELIELTRERDMQNSNISSIWKNLQRKEIQKCLLIFMIPSIVVQISGAQILAGYIPTILIDSIPSVPTYMGSILLQSCFLIGTILSIFFIDKCGRRSLFITSGIFSSILTMLIGVYYVMESVYGIESVSKYSITLYILCVIFLINYSFGLFPIPFIYVGELFDTNFRATASLICSIINSLFAFIGIQLYEEIGSSYGRQYVYFILTICTFLLTTIGYLSLPETKGKSLQHIREDLRKGNKLNTKL